MLCYPAPRMSSEPNPRVVPDAPKNVFEREETVATWDQDYYHPVAERYYDVAVPEMLQAMGARPGDLVLDAGCGPGVHSIRAARYGCRVKAIDLSDRMLAHARARSEEAGVADRIDFQQDDLTDLSLRSGEYPFVFNWGVLIHVPEAEKALDHLTRVVAPGGRLALHVLIDTSLDFAIERFVRRVLGKPLAGLTQTSLGTGVWYDFQEDRLWVQRFRPERLVDAMKSRRFRLVHRRGAELTEFQWRMPSALRPLLLWLNRAAYSLHLPASPFCTQIFVFESEATGEALGPVSVAGVGGRGQRSGSVVDEGGEP